VVFNSLNLGKNIYLIILLSYLFLPSGAFAQADAYTEYTMKAIFLERFTRFVEWPPRAEIDDTSKPFIIAVIGNNPFGPKLDNIYSTQKIRNKKVKIIYASNVDEIAGCHLLFISKSEEKRLDKIISLTRDKPILTVSAAKGFAEKGVLINFYILNGLIRFEINETAVRESGLSTSYLLLKTARIVNPAGVYR
jgi:hypothetical protein